MPRLPSTRTLATGGAIAPWLWTAIVIVLTLWLGPAVGAIALIAFIGLAAILPASLDQIPFYITLLVLFVGLTLIGLRLRSLAEGESVRAAPGRA